MPFGMNFAVGIRRLVDSQMRFVRVGHPVYLRLRNFPDPQDQPWAQLGFSISPTGAQIGTKDVLIEPPPSVWAVSVHNIGQSMGKLRFGARMFLISATFTERQMRARRLASEDLVWRHSDVVGLVTEGKLYSIEDIVPEVVSGRTVTWQLTCNANEIR